MTVLETKIVKKMEGLLSGVTPGLQVQVHQMGRKIFDIALGNTYAYYDLASLTKIIFTTQAFMKAFEQGLWHLDTPVKKFVPNFPFESVKILQCLNHSSGMFWWKPFYQDLVKYPTQSERWSALFSDLSSQAPTENAEQLPSVYSDLGFLLLAYVLEKMFEKPLIDIWKQINDEFYASSTLEFHPNNQPKFDKKLYAPTEERDWRAKVLQGEVHDDNTWALGGCSTHAGLFGSIDDLGWYALHLRALLHGVAKSSIKQKTARLFMARSRPEGLGDFAIGYMMPAKTGSLVGNYFSPQSIGHWGFTGTSVWYDPVYDISVCILSNRTWFGRDNKKFNELRPQLHNWIIEGLRRV